MKRMILWKSDLWRFCLVFAGIGLLFVIGAVVQAMHGQSGEAFGNAFVAALLLTVSLAGALIDRGPAMERVKLEVLRGGLPSARALIWQDSCLNPETPTNRDRIQNPPSIG